MHMIHWALFLTVILSPAPMMAAEKSVEDRRPTPLAVPDEDALARATKNIKQTFAGDYAGATAPAPRAALGQRLLKEGQETTDDSASRYVLLSEARDLAAKAGDAPTACRAIELLAQHFGIAPGEMTMSALTTANRVSYTAANQESLARCAMQAADQALGRDDYEIAPRFAALAESAAGKSKKPLLLAEAQDKQKEITWATQQYAQAKGAIAALAAKPEDADAKTIAGRFKCLAKSDWEHGLPLLAEGSDAALKKLAEKDLAAGGDTSLQAEVADQWWELGEQQMQRARLACRTRAAYWYRRALPKLTGLPKTVAEKRLGEAEMAQNRELRLEPGLLAEIFEGRQLNKVVSRRTDATLDFEWPATNREGVPKGNFSIRWTGLLRAPAAGKYTLIVHVNESARVYLDEKLVLEEAKGTQKHKGTQAVVSLSEGLHPIRVEFSDSGGLSKLHLLWQPPGSKVEEVIPPRALLHEMTPGR